MNSAEPPGRLSRISPVRAFMSVFFAVFLLILLGSALLTFLLPETYKAEARVMAPGATGLELLQSTELLRKVSERLNLPATLAARYGQNNPLEDKRVEDLLRRSIQVQRLPNSDLMRIRVYGRSPEECARWANEFAQTAVQVARQGSNSIQIVEKAAPPLTPSRPNKPLNLALGALVGFLLGIMAGGVGAKLAVGPDTQNSGTK